MTLDDVLADRMPAEFFEREVHTLATDLLGRDLCRWDGDTLRVGRIVETEAYGGEPDPACHGDSGEPTDRTRPMFGPGGVAYVYLIYGMHHCFNVVSAPEGTAAAVLVRAAEPMHGLRAIAAARGRKANTPGQQQELMSGPGKLCQALDIRRERHSGLSLQSDQLFISAGVPVPTERIATTPRIGLNPTTVGESASWPWRYVDAASAHLSRTVAGLT